MIMFYFSFLHFPLSGPVLTNISLPIIPCMIVYVTNNKEPWTLNLENLLYIDVFPLFKHRLSDYIRQDKDFGKYTFGCSFIFISML